MTLQRLTRKQLLMALGDCQNLFGQISARDNDRNPNRSAQVQGLAKRGLDFCVEILGTEKPVAGTVMQPFNVDDFK